MTLDRHEADNKCSDFLLAAKQLTFEHAATVES